MAHYVLGVDGGATKTLALVADLAGTVVGCGRAGGSNLYGPSPEEAITNIAEAVTIAVRAAGIPPDSLVAGGFSLCGADWPEDFDFFHAEMTKRRFGRTVTIVNDAVGGLYAGSPDGFGVAVVCGTGSATAARSPDGARWHASFWQEPDGAVDLARRALRAVYRADLGLDQPTSLTPRVLAHYNRENVENVLHLLTRRVDPSPMRISGLVRLLMEEADRDDPVARCIVEEHGTALGDCALAAARRVGIEGAAFTLVLAGGIFRHPSRLHAGALIARVQTSSPEVLPLHSPFEPVVGALRIALEVAGSTWDDTTRGHLTVSMPPRTLFET
ncbi:MAG: N-acetylglucosamine kinase [Thermomicrobiales bacterium]